MSRPIALFLLSALAVLVLGFSAGLFLTDDAEEVPQPSSDLTQSDVLAADPQMVGSGVRPGPGVVPDPRVERQEAKNRELERRLRALEVGLAAARNTAGAEDAHVVLEPSDAETVASPAAAQGPLPFPDALNEAYTPEGFERVTLEATKACGMPLSVVAIDCSEFPCIAWTRVTGPQPPGQPFSMDSCGPWAEVFKHGTMVVGAVSPADVEPREVYFAWMAMPEQQELAKPAMARARVRTAEMKAALNLQ